MMIHFNAKIILMLNYIKKIISNNNLISSNSNYIIENNNKKIEGQKWIKSTTKLSFKLMVTARKESN